MLFNLLDSASSVLDSASSSAAASGGNDWSMWIMIGVFAVLMIVFMFFNRRNQKKREEETKNLLDSIRPGHKVKTIGGICGTVVEVNSEDNTFVLETGSEFSGKSYMTFDKYAIAQTDAAEKKEEKQEEKKED